MGIDHGGGRNRTHDCIEDHIWLESCEMAKHQGRSCTVHWSDGNSIKATIDQNRMQLTYQYDGEHRHEEIHFTRSTGGVAPVMYFLCPHCGCRVRKLYCKDGRFQCRQCAGLNYYSQQVTQGMNEWCLRINRLLQKHFGYTEWLVPAHAETVRPEKPKGMDGDTYFKLLRQLYHAQGECAKAWLRMVENAK